MTPNQIDFWVTVVAGLAVLLLYMWGNAWKEKHQAKKKPAELPGKVTYLPPECEDPKCRNFRVRDMTTGEDAMFCEKHYGLEPPKKFKYEMRAEHIEEFKKDPVKFIKEIYGIEPDEWQVKLPRQMSKPCACNVTHEGPCKSNLVEGPGTYSEDVSKWGLLEAYKSGDPSRIINCITTMAAEVARAKIDVVEARKKLRKAKEEAHWEDLNNEALIKHMHQVIDRKNNKIDRMANKADYCAPENQKWLYDTKVRWTDRKGRTFFNGQMVAHQLRTWEVRGIGTAGLLMIFCNNFPDASAQQKIVGCNEVSLVQNSPEEIMYGSHRDRPENFVAAAHMIADRWHCGNCRHARVTHATKDGGLIGCCKPGCGCVKFKLVR